MMVAVVVWTTLLLAVAAPAFSITLEECATFNYPGSCYSTMQGQIAAAFTKVGVCQAVTSYITCMEHVGCECNLTLSYNLAHSLTYIQHYYHNQGCPALTGELDQTEGIPCDKWGNTTGSTDGELLVLSSSVSEYVIALDMRCTGFQPCYANYDTDAALAVHSRNLTELCIVLDDLVTCLENAACGCDGGNDTEIIRGVVTEDTYFRSVCEIVRVSDMIPRTDVVCNDDGTAGARTQCDVLDPTYSCYVDFNRELIQNGQSLAVQCQATKTYIECVEGIACQCGLIRDYPVYHALTNAVANYDRTGCASVSGQIIVNAGIQCQDGSGTRPNEDRIVLSLAESAGVEIYEDWCPGIKKCYQDLDERNGIALFQKDHQQSCQNSKLLIECMEETFCGCGVFTYGNTSYILSTIRQSHNQVCLPGAVLREDFECNSITLEECVLNDLPGRCYRTLQNQVSDALSQYTICQAVNDYIDCMETVGCDCNLTLSYDLADALTYMEHYYETQGCPALTGALNETKGIPCDKWGSANKPVAYFIASLENTDNTSDKYDGYEQIIYLTWGSDTGSTDGELLVLSLSVTPYVVELDKMCRGFQACYGDYDSEAAVAVHNRNLTQLCIVLDQLVTCLENAACGCDGDNDTAIIQGVVSEDVYYRRTCEIVRGSDMIPRDDVKCNDDGSAVTRTICDIFSPIYKCKADFDTTALLYGTSIGVQCPATKTYIECVEGTACQCGLIRDYVVYQGLMNAVARYNRTGCLSESGPMTVTPGIHCPDGTGTTEDEDRLVMEVVEYSLVRMHNTSCPGLAKCQQEYEENYGIALFEKNLTKMCGIWKIFYECMAVTLCQCGLYEEESTASHLQQYRKDQDALCLTDSIIRNDFECNYGSIGIKCLDNNDCHVLKNTVCSSTGTCDCKEKYLFSPSSVECTEVYNGKIGSECRDGGDCQVVTNSHCGISGVCSCKKGYLYSKNKCNPVSSAMKTTPGHVLVGLLSFIYVAFVL